MLAAVVLLVGGCAARVPLLDSQLPAGDARGAAVELEATPFYPQRAYQCGPAALATVLVASGVATDADRLVSQVYLPGRKGSLQVELVAAIRRHDRVAYRIDGRLSALDLALRDRHPVLVLLNLGLDTLPVWHFAVVVGLDAGRDVVILRSGTERRRVMPARRFDAAWQRAGRWGVIVTSPGTIPALAHPETWLEAVSRLESTGRLDAARIAYLASLQRWPGQARALFGLGNVHYLQQRPAQAVELYRDYLERAPDDPAAWNNLASAHLANGALSAARESLARASTLASSAETGAEISAAIAATYAELAQAERR
jgi:tetratricopeptide (TPR) repeat protein